MPRPILFVQGAGAGVHDQWDSKLVRSLARELGPGYSVRYPRMPDEADPRYAAWKAALLSEFDELEDAALLVGHSIGGSVLLHVLAEHRLNVCPAALFLIAAPFIGDGGWRSDDIHSRADLAEHLPDGMPVFLYHGTADDSVPFSHLQLHATALPGATVRVLSQRDHQLNDDLSEVARDIRSIAAR